MMFSCAHILVRYFKAIVTFQRHITILDALDDGTDQENYTCMCVLFYNIQQQQQWQHKIVKSQHTINTAEIVDLSILTFGSDIILLVVIIHTVAAEYIELLLQHVKHTLANFPQMTFFSNNFAVDLLGLSQASFHTHTHKKKIETINNDSLY